MQLYILRHGIAEDGRPGSDDAVRALTGEGKRKLRDVLRAAKGADVAPSLVISSPYVRAVETARIAIDVLGHGGQMLTTEALTPGSDPEAVWDELRVHKSSPSILLAGHEPLLSRLTGYLLAAPSLFVDFKKGAIVRIDVEEFGAHPRGVLKWMLTPKLAGAS